MAARPPVAAAAVRRWRRRGGGGGAAAAMQDCAVCLEAPQPGEVVSSLGCLHAFHKDCIDKWLQRSTTCPVYKHAV